MAKKLDYFLPFNDLVQYVPQNLRNSVISGLIGNLFNRFMTRDESIPLYGYVGLKPAALEDRTPKIPTSSVERDVNAIIPVLNWNQGSVRQAFTAQDLLNKAKVLGIPSDDLSWLYTQANNYLPPIDIDKFAKFYNYFWYAKAAPFVPAMPWNQELLPEYYTIARPAPSDLDKVNVVTATTSQVTLTGTGFIDQSFTLSFTSATDFTMTANSPLPFGFTGATQTFSLSPLPGAPSGSALVDTFSFDVTNGSSTVTLVSFAIQRDPRYDEFGVLVENGSFTSGDSFVLDTVFLSQNFSSSFAGSPGFKGKIVNVAALNEFQTVAGVQVSQGQRVLVKNNSPFENGIWIVQPQGWIRADDFKGATVVSGARVWVSDGTNARNLYTSVPGGWALTASNVDSNTNQWQEGNFWIHSSQLRTLGLSRSDVVQATRPIIEFSTGLEMNSHVINGVPSSGPTGYYQQAKTEFNQLPLFNIYYYDGTHSGKVSSIFYYVEDSAADLDVPLQRRVKTAQSDSADYIFNHGLIDDDGDQLFYKKNGDLKSIWHPGYISPTVVDFEFAGKKKGKIEELIVNFGAVNQTWTLTTTTNPVQFTVTGSVSGLQPQLLTVGSEYVIGDVAITIVNDTIPFEAGDSFTFTISAGSTVSTPVFTGPIKGTISSITAIDAVQQQVWIATATSSTTFEVSSSKYGAVGDATVGTPYVNTDVGFTITAGTLPYDIGDSFVFRLANIDTPRYLTRKTDGTVVDFYGGPAADLNKEGAYQVPRSLSYNPFNESRGEIVEGTLAAHFQSILNNQLESHPIDPAFGGVIKGWSEQHTLLASLLMQRDLTPISIVDLAQRQYETALNSVVDLFNTSIAQYFVEGDVVNPSSANQADYNAKLNNLVDSILNKLKQSQSVRQILFDSTSPVAGFPATLPQLGIRPLSKPGVVYDNQLGLELLQHHDGHLSPLFVDSLDFRTKFLNENGTIQVSTRIGTQAAVQSLSSVAPTTLFKGALWIRPFSNGLGSDILAFDVTFDIDPTILNYGTGVGQITPTVGMTWYQISTGTLRHWDGTNWVNAGSPNQVWTVVEFDTLLNQVLIEVERRLYVGMNATARLVDFASLFSNQQFRTQIERELFTYASVEGLNPLGSDYVPTNAFTWNYSSASVANFAPLSSSVVPARWFNVLKSHQATVAGALPTEAPHREVWRLFGFSTLAAWWATLTPAQQASYLPSGGYAEELSSANFGGSVRLVQTVVGATPPVGLQTIDGVNTNTGDWILISNDLNPANNGVWVVSSGAWARAPVPQTAGTYFTVESGLSFSRTTWRLLADVPNLSIDPMPIGQVRLWSAQLWFDLQALYPTLKLSVDTNRDELLPPYVAATNPMSSNALTTTMPTGLASSYTFGQGSPVETMWTKTIEYGYSLARALFRFDPMMFLGFCWGYNWVEVDDLLFEGTDINFPGHTRFKLHGETIEARSRGLPTLLSSSVSIGADAITIGAISGTASSVRLKYDAYSTISGRKQSFTVRTSSLLEPVGYVFEGSAPVTVSNSSITLTDVRIEDFGKPFRIGDEFVISSTDGWVSFIIDFIPTTIHRFMGFGQTFTHALRDLSIESDSSFALNAYRGWNVDLGHRLGGLVATDDLKVRTDSDTLSESSYDLILKKNEISKDLWVQALRITVSEFGAAKDLGDFGQAPIGDGSDWVFKIDGYNPRYTNISYFTYNTSANLVTFQALSGETTKQIWTQPTIRTGVTNTFLPLTITGVQNVINFLFGYSNWLLDQGWRFNVIGDSKDSTVINVDAETGRSRTWQLEIESFIDKCYRGISQSEGIIANPFQDRIWVNQDTGLLSQFIDTPLFDVTANAAVYDVAGINLKSEDLFVIRGNQRSELSALAPMYSVHAQIDDYEHLMVFNKFVEDSIQNGVLYEPFSGARVVTYTFNGRRQAGSTFRPEFGGYYVANGQVRQNLQASTDNIANFYNADTAFQSDLTSRHAMALLGFNTKDYFDQLDITTKSQFNFWRGLIQAKGTNMSVGAYLNNNRFDDAKLDEYWAYKIAEYGDARERTFPEVKLSVTDTLQQFTQLQFDPIPGTEIPNFISIDSADENRWFSIEDLDNLPVGGVSFLAEEIGRYSEMNAVVGQPMTLPFVADKLVYDPLQVQQLNATTIVPLSQQISVIGYAAADRRYAPLKLIDYVENQVIEEIPLWHPAAGKHSPIAQQDINIVSAINPARFNYSTLTTNNPSYDPLRPWGDQEVGRVWFNTSNLTYVPYFDPVIFPSRQERLSRWGALAEHATLDVYEWVKSPVPPSQYNALAIEQAGDADLDESTKAAGEVAGEQLYSRTRSWSVRPIAWSRAGRALAAAHPSFEYESNNPVIVDSSLVIETESRFTLGVGTFEDRGIEVGMRIGAWDNTPLKEKPLSEHEILRFETSLQTSVLGTSFGQVTVPVGAFVPVECVVSIESSSHQGITGQLLFERVEPIDIRRIDIDGVAVDAWDIDLQLKVIEVDNNDINFEIISVGTVLGLSPVAGAGGLTAPGYRLHGATIQVFAGQVFEYSFANFGLKVKVTVATSGTFSADCIALAIVAGLDNLVHARDAAIVEDIVPTSLAALNNSSLAAASTNWRAWPVPTQAQLTSDAQAPNGVWRPYLGDLGIPFSPSIETIEEAIAYAETPLTLNDGTVIERFNTTWSDWATVSDLVIDEVQQSTGSVTILHPNSSPAAPVAFDVNRTSIFVNGIALLRGAFSVDGDELTITSVATGSIIKVIVRRYEPSAAELGFNPEVEEDFSIQIQYKRDYEYVVSQRRDGEGSLSQVSYYFWVKNKSVPGNKNKFSTQAIAQQLQNGPPNYLTFQIGDAGVIGNGSSANPFRYDAITISGLSFIVGQDDKFKLRLLRDFTLRDDPNGLTLKNTHTEWSLIRPGQRTRIPEKLWLKLVDSMCGVDTAGNQLPSLRRQLYDERTGSKSQFGFGPDQTLAPSNLLISSVAQTIVNTKLTNTSANPDSSGIYPPDFIEFLNVSQFTDESLFADDKFFDAAETRQTMTNIWTSAKPAQINEIFFAALDDILSANLQLTDIFKTSRLSAYSIRVIQTAPGALSYE